MEFFHAKIYWSGHGEVITNVAELPISDTGKLIHLYNKYAILWISLGDTEIKKLRCYLENELGRCVSNAEFENSMGFVFYIGTSVDSMFNLEKFLDVCNQIQIKPKMVYYLYRHTVTVN
ncbi:MAG: hypothetical protein K2J16_00790 [Clostridia bacterium]|nr:hypothetical protein [Clostridia bacterium]